MSYIPNTAMPHAYVDDDQNKAGVDWRGYLDQVRDLAGRGVRRVRGRPREAAVGAVALVAGLAFAGWRASRRKRSPVFA